MKNFVFALMLLFACPSVFGQAKVRTVPEPVQKTFTAIFPNASNVNWLKEQKVYTANCDLGICKGIAHIDAQGRLLEIRQSIAVKDLPAEVKHYTAKHFPSMATEEAWKITDEKGRVAYKILIGGMEILFDEKGKVLR